MAINLHQQGFFEKAEEIYLQLLERHPEEKEIIYFLALIAIETNNNLIATNWLQQYLSVDQKNSDVYYLLGNLFKEEKQFDKAIQAYTQAQEFSPEIVALRIKKIINQDGILESKSL